LELIAEQANRCKNIVGGLLNFARKNQVRYTETDILAFVRHSTESVIVPENITIDIVSKLTDNFVMIDTDQMMQVLTNLEKNAVEAMPEGGKITIVLNGNDDEIKIDVSDTGIGISPENMDKIFTPFFTTKKPGKGTGLGLPLIYGIVKMHKGNIHVKSNQDPYNGPLGTTFKISIPRKNISEKTNI
jgi:signal transduction histidine kinase